MVPPFIAAMSYRRVLYGALGALSATRWLSVAAVAVGLAFVAEPVVVFALGRAGVSGGSVLDYPGPWIAEAAFGLVLAGWLYRRGSATGAVRS